MRSAQTLHEAYASQPFVHVTDQPPATKWVAGSNGVQLTARYDERTGRVVALSAIDNLGKGAAGQMIQCANLMLGLEETAGLTTIGVLSMSVTAAEGFVAAGCHAGIKRRRFDMALLATDNLKPVPARQCLRRTSSPRLRSSSIELRSRRTAAKLRR